MATQTIEFKYSTGQTLSVKLVAIGTDTITETASATERTNNLGTYTVDFTDAPAGWYEFTVFQGSNVAVSDYVYLTLTTDVFRGSSTGADTTALDTTVDAIKAITDQMVFTVANQLDVNTLTQTAGIVVVPNSVSRSIKSTLKAYVGEDVTFPPLTPTNVDGTTLDTTAIPLEVIVESRDKTDVATVADGSITKTATTIQFTTLAADANATAADKKWAVRRTDTKVVVGLHGEYVVEYAATGD